MARVTARQAFTRARTKRLKSRTTSERNLLQARNRFIQQLSSVGIACDNNNPAAPETKYTPNRLSIKRAHAFNNNKKITDFFSSSKRCDHFVSPPAKRNRSPTTTSSLNPSGIEVVTIYDSDDEQGDSNNNDTNQDRYFEDSENQRGNHNGHFRSHSSSSSHNCSEANQSFLDSSGSSDTKPTMCKLDMSCLGTSFEDLNFKIKVDEEIEIVEMLPPIPLRNHPVHDLDLDS